MSVTDQTMMPALLEVLAALQAQVAQVANPPLHYRVVTGTQFIASLTQDLDEACQGVAWVRPINFVGTNDFPIPLSQTPTMDGDEPPESWSLEIELGVVRCGAAPGPDFAPTDAQLIADAAAVMDDAAAMRRVPLALMANPLKHAIGWVWSAPWEPLASEANEIGGTIHLSVQLPNIDC